MAFARPSTIQKLHRVRSQKEEDRRAYRAGLFFVTAIVVSFMAQAYAASSPHNALMFFSGAVALTPFVYWLGWRA